jgi:hypothetical protein
MPFDETGDILNTRSSRPTTVPFPTSPSPRDASRDRTSATPNKGLADHVLKLLLREIDDSGGFADDFKLVSPFKLNSLLNRHAHSFGESGSNRRRQVQNKYNYWKSSTRGRADYERLLHEWRIHPLTTASTSKQQEPSPLHPCHRVDHEEDPPTQSTTFVLQSSSGRSSTISTMSFGSGTYATCCRSMFMTL